MAISDLISPDRVETGWTPMTRDIPTAGELVASGFDNMARNQYMGSKSYGISGEISDRNDEFANIDGGDISKIMQPDDSVARSANPFMTQQTNLDNYIINKRQTDPRYNYIKTYPELEQAARDKAVKSQADFADIQADTRPGFFNRFLPTFVGQAGSIFTDPLSIVTLPLGAMSGLSILRAAAMEAGIQASIAAAAQPSVGAWQRELGKDYGFSDAMSQVGFAALLSAGGTVTARGLVKGYATGKPLASAAFDRLAQSPALNAWQQRAAQYMERYAFFKERNPIAEPADIDEAAHMQTVQNVGEAFENHQPASAAEIDVARSNQPAWMDQPLKSGEAQREFNETMQGERNPAGADIPRSLQNGDIITNLGDPNSPVYRVRPPDNPEFLSFADNLKEEPPKPVEPVTLYRDVNAERAAEDTGKGGNQLLSEDRAAAEKLAGEGGSVYEHPTVFNNLLEAKNYTEALQKLGFGRRAAPMSDLIEAARQNGYDGIRFTDDKQYVQIPGSQKEARPVADLNPQVTPVTPEQFKATREASAVDQVVATQKAELDRLAKTEGDTVIQLDDRVVKLSDLLKEHAENERMMSEITSCAVKGE